ncbi:MAG: hypothetical protein V1913_18595 [Fibrobacterota bacterium]
MTRIGPSELSAIRAFKTDPKDRKNRYALNNVYWDLLYTIVRERADGGSAKILHLSEDSALIDLGILDVNLFENGEKDWKEIQAGLNFVNDDMMFTFTEWIEREYQRTLNFDKKDHIRNEITALEHELTKHHDEFAAKQDDRRTLFQNYLEPSLSSRSMATPAFRNQYLARFDRIRTADDMEYEIQVKQKKISTGKFLDVTIKRELAERIKEYQKYLTGFKNLLSELRNPAAEKEILAASEEIHDLAVEIVDLESKRNKKEEELKNLVDQTATLSPKEIEASINEMLDYFKGLMILSSKRVKAEPLAVAAGKSRPTTKAALKKVIQMIEEFDPKVFKNDRVKYLGLPKFVILPGFGNGLYDWKNNAILIPTQPCTRLEESVFAGVVEYKLDMDDDKALLMSYNKLEDNKGIKSHLRLKERFAKDYAIFMGQETRGYKVLKGDARAWFNHEIAPNRFEIKIPLEFDPIAMPQEAYNTLVAALNEKVAKGTAGYRDFYGLGIIANYNEAHEKAIDYFKKSYETAPDFIDALFNLAVTQMKKQMRREAAATFTEYIKKSPQNWWTGVCQEHLMKLK